MISFINNKLIVNIIWFMDLYIHLNNIHFSLRQAASLKLQYFPIIESLGKTRQNLKQNFSSFFFLFIPIFHSVAQIHK